MPRQRCWPNAREPLGSSQQQVGLRAHAASLTPCVEANMVPVFEAGAVPLLAAAMQRADATPALLAECARAVGIIAAAGGAAGTRCVPHTLRRSEHGACLRGWCGAAPGGGHAAC